MSTIDEQDWLGDVPDKPRNLGGRKRTKGTGDRSRLLECPECGFKCRASAGAVERVGRPTCGCGTQLILPNLRDRALLEPDEIQAEVAAAVAHIDDPERRRGAFNRRMRDLGWLDLTIPAPPRRSGVGQKRCQWDGGYCVKFATGRYCPEHSHQPNEYGQRGV